MRLSYESRSRRALSSCLAISACRASSRLASASARAVGDGDQSVAPAVFQPLFVAARGLKQIAVPLNGEPGLGEEARKLLSEVTVGEVDATHAARE